VRNSLTALSGVNQVEVDLDEEIAIVRYDAARLQVAALVEATTAIGFPSSVSTAFE